MLSRDSRECPSATDSPLSVMAPAFDRVTGQPSDAEPSMRWARDGVRPGRTRRASPSVRLTRLHHCLKWANALSDRCCATVRYDGLRSALCLPGPVREPMLPRRSRRWARHPWPSQPGTPKTRRPGRLMASARCSLVLRKNGLPCQLHPPCLDSRSATGSACCGAQCPWPASVTE